MYDKASIEKVLPSVIEEMMTDEEKSSVNRSAIERSKRAEAINWLAAEMYEQIAESLCDAGYEAMTIVITSSYGRDEDGVYLGGEKFSEVRFFKTSYDRTRTVRIQPGESDIHPALYSALVEHSRKHVRSVDEDQSLFEIAIEAADKVRRTYETQMDNRRRVFARRDPGRLGGWRCDMNITLMCIGVILAVIAMIVFGVWLHGYIEDEISAVRNINGHIKTLYGIADRRIESTEAVIEEISLLRKQQEAMQKYLNTMPHPKHRYGLNPEERDLIAGVIEAEAGGEDWTGKVLIAQCLLNACEKDDIRPIQAVRVYQYATARPEPSELSYAAVRYVFDEGQTMTEQPVLYFYAPSRCESTWHESQRYLFEHGGHRFFTAKED